MPMNITASSKWNARRCMIEFDVLWLLPAILLCCVSCAQEGQEPSVQERHSDQAFEDIVRDIVLESTGTALAELTNERFEAMLREAGATSIQERRLLKKLDHYLPENLDRAVVTVYFLRFSDMSPDVVDEKHRLPQIFGFSSRGDRNLILRIVRLGNGDVHNIIISVVATDDANEWNLDESLLQLDENGEWEKVWTSTDIMNDK